MSMSNTILSTRDEFTRAMIDLSDKDEKYVLVLADSLLAGRAVPYHEKYPERVFDVGIAEQNALGVAAGLASCGLVPFALTYAGFLTMRACEQLRTFIAYPGLNVKLAGLNGGVLGGNREGVTHQFIEDIGILRAIPGITIVSPADATQVYKAVLALGECDGPCYLRLGSGKELKIYEDDAPFELGKVNIVEEFGSDVAIFSSGFILDRAIEAAKQLKLEGINATVVDVHTLKPLDDEGIAKVIARTRCAVTVEDHNIIGGLGSAICEVMSEKNPVNIKRIGLKDVFPKSGEANELLDEYGMGISDIVKAAKEVISRK
jgi:transketolase